MIQLGLDDVMIAHEYEEVYKTRAVYLTALGFKKFLQFVVAERGVLYEYLADDADLDHIGVGGVGDLLKVLDYVGNYLVKGGEAEMQVYQLIHPLVYHPVGLALVVLIGSDLI